MNGLLLSVAKVMNPSPRTVESRHPLADAYRTMHRFKLHHLPVLDRGRVVGLLSRWDARLIEQASALDPAELKVEDVMLTDPLIVPPSATVEEVVRRMARGGYSAAVVATDGRVQGLLTADDALRLLSVVLGALRGMAEELPGR
jgi:acetoin utilization protein AcuB